MKRSAFAASSRRRTIPTPPSGIPKFGFATGFVIMNQTDAQINTHLDQIKAIGAQYVRWDLPDSISWRDQFNKILTGCEARGLKAIATLRGTSGPIGAAGAGDFANRMINFFGTRVMAWEYVNEPNLGNRYTGAQYGPELAAAYNAIKAVQSNAIVVGGTMGWDANGKYTNFWPGVLSNGGSGHFDVVSVHNYGFPNEAPWTESLTLNTEGKPMIITEAGLGGNRAPYTTLGEQTQADVITAALQDTRFASICIYNMYREVLNYELARGQTGPAGQAIGTLRPGYAAYQAVAP